MAKIISIGVWGDGVSIDLEVHRDETVANLKELINETVDIPPDQMRLAYRGRILSDFQGVDYYGIMDGSTIIVSLEPQPAERCAELISDASAAESHTAWKAKAKEGDFDVDLHIVDPQSHFRLLEQLEREVMARSEFCRNKGKYNIHEISKPDLISQLLRRSPDLPTWLLETLDESMANWKVSALGSCSGHCPLRIGSNQRRRKLLTGLS